MRNSNDYEHCIGDFDVLLYLAAHFVPTSADSKGNPIPIRTARVRNPETGEIVTMEVPAVPFLTGRLSKVSDELLEVTYKDNSNPDRPVTVSVSLAPELILYAVRVRVSSIIQPG